MRITYDSEANAMMIYLREGKPAHYQIIHSPTNPRMIIGFDENENPMNIELLYVSDYVADPQNATVADLVQQAIAGE